MRDMTLTEKQLTSQPPIEVDDGATWETNWVMEMTRTEETP